MKSRFTMPVTLSLVLAMGLSVAGQHEEPIRIGATMSETGAYATQGVPARDGYLLCAKDVNAAGGLLGRDIEFVIRDDQSDTDTAIAHYEEMLADGLVDAVMGPYGSTLTEAVAPVTERHDMVQISPLAATTSIWEQGREYLFMVLPPAELFLAGLIDMADGHGLERVAVIAEDQLFPRAAADGAAELADQRGMTVVFHETYPSGIEDFSTLIQAVDEGDVQVLAMAASALDNFIDVTGQMKAMNVNVKMFGTSGAVTEYQQALGEDAEYVYGLSAWEPGLPNPGSDEFVAAYEQSYGRAPSFHAAGAYGSCQLFVEAVTRAGSLDQDAIREELLSLETETVFGPFAVDERGYQTANQGLFVQWQDGEKVVVWPDELATAEPRYPTPSWDER
ncbi:amino acid ABC transporter substrate-binding protein [Wenzhouxiangella sp. AB-CW3]|uniref:amino acid ABC transporter substrate-binding protein n=1 Tax=Wenzhouxiangella sp. AB-CW3 TaxID=2771012 RepID=UPI00168A6BE6|nr:amino acid ABC transporter substrate-binding protein [Wenzhouxiangella sp. AB-CW3]QOC22552.1 amino acid ABC transporter substrate-binding protein [Wenzhouxiangella sp. AB-CW3]